jgi:2,3-bisphosphoglycerate-independent phosphoglycerate mutase
VSTYDEQPEMSAIEVKNRLIEAIDTQKYNLIVANFANGDMVGHTGVYEAIEKAVKTVDECVGKVVETAIRNNYNVVIIADHGNADFALNPDNSPNTAHSLNPVPIIMVTDEYSKVDSGVLADVAPTILTLMNIDVPQEMTGKILIKNTIPSV